MINWTLTFPDFIGFVGVGLLIGAYAGLQLGRLEATKPAYSALNAIAALLIAFSLFYSFNAASMVIEIFWFAISMFGLWRALQAKRAEKADHQSGTPSE